MRSSAGAHVSIGILHRPMAQHSSGDSNVSHPGPVDSAARYLSQNSGNVKAGGEADSNDPVLSGHSSMEGASNVGPKPLARMGDLGVKRVDSKVDLSSLGRGGTGGIWDASPAEMASFRRSSYNVGPLNAPLVPHACEIL